MEKLGKNVAIPYGLIDSADFKERTMMLKFRNGEQTELTCPETNPQYEQLKKEMLLKMGPEKVTFHDH